MEIPLVTSDIEARHDGHEFDAFGAIGIPHMQQSTLTIVPPTRAILENWFCFAVSSDLDSLLSTTIRRQ